MGEFFRHLVIIVSNFYNRFKIKCVLSKFWGLFSADLGNTFNLKSSTIAVRILVSRGWFSATKNLIQALMHKCFLRHRSEQFWRGESHFKNIIVFFRLKKVCSRTKWSSHTALNSGSVQTTAMHESTDTYQYFTKYIVCYIHSTFRRDLFHAPG